ncbi:MAG TPA: hypothetical protein VK717_10500 [Opitutaceae bacterium]|nr:hypothetical protein [Opitutaceae bacterium]
MPRSRFGFHAKSARRAKCPPPCGAVTPAQLRSKVVARGHALAADPDYPSPEIIRIVAEHLVKFFK